MRWPLQAYLGHRSINSTTRYAALAPGRFKNIWGKGQMLFWSSGHARLTAELCFVGPKQMVRPPPPTRRGFGTRVMESMIRQMNADMRFDWRNDSRVKSPYRRELTTRAPKEAR
jgi:hypothetical protein